MLSACEPIAVALSTKYDKTRMPNLAWDPGTSPR